MKITGGGLHQFVSKVNSDLIKVQNIFEVSSESTDGMNKCDSSSEEANLDSDDSDFDGDFMILMNDALHEFDFNEADVDMLLE